MATSSLSSSTISSAAENVAGRVRDAQTAAQDTISEAMRRGSDVAQEVRDTWSDLDVAVRSGIRERPYTALAVAAAFGFLYAVARGR